MSLLFNQTCLNERLLPNYMYSYLYIIVYIYIYIYILIYVCVYACVHIHLNTYKYMWMNLAPD